MRHLAVSLLAFLIIGCQSSPEYAAATSWSCSSRVELSSLWGHLRDKYDADGDNRVTAAEYTRGEVRFANYDRDGNGTLEPVDFPEDTYLNGFNHMILRHADSDEDEQITRAEWQAFIAAMDPDGNDWMTADEVRAVLGRWADDWRLFLLSFDQNGDGVFRRDDLEITFRDQDFDGNGVLTGRETAGWDVAMEQPEEEPPAVGDPAPDFELPYAEDSERSFQLATGAPGRPVALIFGSYT